MASLLGFLSFFWIHQQFQPVNSMQINLMPMASVDRREPLVSIVDKQTKELVC